MSKTTLQQITNLLNKHRLSFKHFHHKKIKPTSIDAATLRGTNLSDGAKALILKTKSGKYIQTIVPANRRADLKKIKKLINEKNVSLAHPQEVFELSDCVVGSVPPFGILWNIPVYFDELFLKKEIMVFSAGTLEDSMEMRPQDYIKAVNPSIADLSKEM